MEVKTTNLRIVSQGPTRALGPQQRRNFRETIATLNGSAAPDDLKALSSKISHRVQPKETLFGIAREQLINSGQNASPSASMAYALKLAKDNHIQNPDLIYAGQILVLDRINSSDESNKNPTGPAAINASNHAGIDTKNVINNAKVDKFYNLDWQESSMKMGRESYEAEDPAGLMVLSSNKIIDERPIALASNNEHIRDIDLQSPNASNSTTSNNSSFIVSDLLRKGVVGQILDGLPIESSTRSSLQQANAVVSNSFTGRALGTLLGVGGVIPGIAGLLWGLFSAKQIEVASIDETKQGVQTDSTTH